MKDDSKFQRALRVIGKLSTLDPEELLQAGPLPTRHLTESRIELMWLLHHRAGYDFFQIAAAIGMHESTVRRAVLKLDAKRKGRVGVACRIQGLLLAWNDDEASEAPPHAT
jgi:hypothetical protein